MKICDKCSNECESQLSGKLYCVNCTKNEMGSFEVDIRNIHNPVRGCLIYISILARHRRKSSFHLSQK